MIIIATVAILAAINNRCHRYWVSFPFPLIHGVLATPPNFWYSIQTFSHRKLPKKRKKHQVRNFVKHWDRVETPHLKLRQSLVRTEPPASVHP